MLKNLALTLIGIGLMTTLVAFPAWITRGFHEAVVAALTPAGQ